jgi:metal-dependent amidase/aminoacylase/carboxypeptidase family protein
MVLTRAPSVVTIGMIQGGVRGNIIPDSVVMLGTIRTLEPSHRIDIHERIRRTAEGVAAASGAEAEVTIVLGVPVTYNDPALTERMAPTLRRVARDGNAAVTDAGTWAEDFSFFQEKIPGLFFGLGVTPDGADWATVAGTHSPYFFADEGALPVGVRAMVHLAVDYLTGRP